MESEEREKIEQICGTIGRTHPLRAQARAVLADPDTRLGTVQPVLRALLRPSRLWPQERVVASWLIAHADWSEAQRGALSDALSLAVDKATKARRRNRNLLRWFQRGMVSSFVLCLTYVVLGLCRLLPNYMRFDSSYSPIVSICLVTLTLSVAGAILGCCDTVSFSSLIDRFRLRHMRPAVEALGQLGHPASLATIGTAATFDPLQDVAATALMQVTAGLRPEHYGALPQPSVPALCTALTAAAPETVPVLLQALAVIGDGRAIKPVENLAATDIRLDVRATATQLLPILHQRDQESKAASLLLRASASPEASQTLLRAVREQSTTDPTQLLRATTASQDRTV